MKEGKKKLSSLINDFEKIKINDKTTVWNTEIIEAYELQNLLLQSLASIESALNRKKVEAHMQEWITLKEMIKIG